MKRTIAKYALPCIGLMLAGCKESVEQPAAPVAVKVWQAAATASHNQAVYSGTVEEARSATLSFAVSGTVQQIFVHEGQRVSQGQLIAVVDPTSLTRTHEAAQALLEQASDACRRMKQLHDNGSLPEIQWVEVQNKLKQAQSAEQIARKNVADCRLYAPFSGVIAEKHVEAGQNALPGMPVAKLSGIGRVKVCIAVPEREVSGIVPGQSFTVSVPALGGQTFVGTVAEKGVAANSLSRAYEVRIAVDNARGELLPGMLCEASAATAGSGRTAMIVPARAVALGSDNRHFVWLCEKGKAVRRFVTTAGFAEGGVMIAHGLGAGDEVIVEGQQKVSEGMVISVQR